MLLQGALKGQRAGRPGVAWLPQGSLPPPAASSRQPGNRARWRLCSCHLFSWLHCLATAWPCVLSALEEEAFLHGPSGRTRSCALARAAPHDGFSDYDFLMWGLLSHVADAIPSAVCFLKELLEGEICTPPLPAGACSHARVWVCVHTQVRLCTQV